MKNKILLVLTGSLIAFTLIQCNKTDLNNINATGYCDGVVTGYTADVEPLINTYCLLGSNCHSPGSTNAGGELTDYNKIFMKRGEIRSAVYSGIMPQMGSLTTEQRKKIVCWIDNGAVNN